MAGNRFEDWIKHPDVSVPIQIQLFKFPAYDFPKLHQISEDLRRQYEFPSDVPKSEQLLTLDPEDYIYLKGIIKNIDKKQGKHYTINYEALILLTLRLRGFSKKIQETEMYNIIRVMEDFAHIEKCLVSRYKHGEKLYKMMHSLDVTFENWLYILLKKTGSVGSYTWRKHFTEYRNLLQVDLQRIDNGIDICFAQEEAQPRESNKLLQTGVSNGRIREFYNTLRNEFMISCYNLGIQLPERFVVTFEFIRQISEVICNSQTTIDISLKFIEKYGFPKTESRFIYALVIFYCNFRKRIQLNDIIQIMMATKEYKDKLSQPMINKYEKVATKQKLNKVPDTFEEAEQIEQAQQAEQAPYEEKKKTDLLTKNSTQLTKTFNYISNNGMGTLQDYIMNTEYISNEGKACVIYALYAIKKSFQIEAWNQFSNSVNKHSQIALGRVYKGRVPEHPIELIKQGKLIPVLRRDLALGNLLKVLSVTSTVYGPTIIATIQELKENYIK